MEFDAEDVMGRIAVRLGVTSGRPTVREADSGLVLSVAGVAPSDMPPIAVKSEYVLGELLEYSDAEFVDTAFTVVLGRCPASDEARHYLTDLRDGSLTKVELLGRLRWSAEGRARGKHVDGLLIPYTMQRLKRSPLLGPLLAWVHANVRLDRSMRRGELQAALLRRSISRVAIDTNGALATLESRIAALETLPARLTQISDLLQSADAGLQGLQAGQQSCVSEIDALNARSDRLERSLSAGLEESHRRSSELTTTSGEKMAAIEAALATSMAMLEDSLATSVGKLGESIATSAGKFEAALAQSSSAVEGFRPHIEAHGAAIAMLLQAKDLAESGERGLDALYVAFENRFRGTPELLRRRLLPYVDVLRGAGAGTVDRPVLDIGCGGGEFLQLLREHGVVGRGVETNALSVELGRGQGLSVEHMEGLRYLESLPDACLGAITAIHVAEHLAFERLIKLIDQARRTLLPGGLLILETPNPENLLVGSHYFYLDPTHRNPLPPVTLGWLVQARGFEDVRIERMTEAREMPAPRFVPVERPSDEAINEVLALMHAPPDYSVVGRKR